VVFFRGSIAPQSHEFNFLQKLNIKIRPDTAAGNEAWAVRLSHPVWGTARLAAPVKTTPIPKPILQFDARLDPSEKAEAALGRSGVKVEVEGEKGDVLRDRKRLLRFLNAVMGSDGLIALDLTAYRFWSRAALADELCHDADLDIDSLFTIHAIYDEQKTTRWYHTHGLAEIGFFDFDVIRPHADLISARCHDFARAVAFGIVEEKVQPSTPVARLSSAGPIRLVEIGEFNRRASKPDKLCRDTDELHNKNRTVLCDPVRPSWVHRFFPPPVTPSKLLSGPQGEFMVYFPSHATRLMEKRARKTYSMFRVLTDEFAELKSKPIVKLGYRIDGGGEDDLEHMWFEVNALHEDSIDATLVNQPNHISKMKTGDRHRHSLEKLTDWMLIGPVGTINPRDTRAARIARANREKILEVLTKAG
jgi:uncharacterized protein YegJ (DUF2314 family)